MPSDRNINITLISGGSGSRTIQKALAKLTNIPISFSVIVNCYDNGKSTGWTRRFFRNEILGPSDLRKNQLLRHRLIHGKTDLFNYLKHRFSVYSQKHLEQEVSRITENICSIVSQNQGLLLEEICNYFLSKTHEYSTINLVDFSYTNIIYGYLAYILGSMSNAASFMEDILIIPKDSVVLNSDKNLFLKAYSHSGIKINDESEIVAWNNSDDKIENIFLEDENGRNHIPNLSKLAKNILYKSDIVIFCPGTQFSSLFPTYLTNNFNQVIEESSAEKYLIINNSEDKDMKGVNSLQFIQILSKYLHIDKIHKLTVVYNSNAAEMMKYIDNSSKYIIDNFSPPKDNIHDGVKLMDSIFNDYRIKVRK
ncbi:2-phospho-L-lactate transferase CofD family protein [Acaryochloris marina]|uniref:2-phospho-L-lactate transferase CofD family protein n=1 Tax=Acaryochloris marina TaxID=155978 RepID=UPI0021C45A97|nr:2-phospho-L-lactate transferase CofD family protein [Acaryochloris marina]BDM83783.1 hypothetical protein AM10699_66440 [Acaryochloris marina MBIC10699]